MYNMYRVRYNVANNCQDYLRGLGIGTTCKLVWFLTHGNSMIFPIYVLTCHTTDS